MMDGMDRNNERKGFMDPLIPLFCFLQGDKTSAEVSGHPGRTKIKHSAGDAAGASAQRDH